MNAELYERVCEAFHAARDMDEPERSRYVSVLASEDHELHHELSTMLKFDTSSAGLRDPFGDTVIEEGRARVGRALAKEAPRSALVCDPVSNGGTCVMPVPRNLKLLVALHEPQVLVDSVELHVCRRQSEESSLS